MYALSLLVVLWFFWSATALHLLRPLCGAGAADPQATETEQRARLSSETGNGAASRQQANHIESAANLHRKRIQTATNLHPTSLTVDDHHGPLMTMSDSDDTAKGPPTKQTVQVR